MHSRRAPKIRKFQHSPASRLACVMAVAGYEMAGLRRAHAVMMAALHFKVSRGTVRQWIRWTVGLPTICWLEALTHQNRDKGETK